MTYDQLIGHYGALHKVAEALGLDRRTVHAWKNKRRIPSKWQVRAQTDSAGKLRADKEARADAAEFVAFMKPEAERETA